jgi:ribosome assembly protein YihI (activator of Der GTPase)
VAIQPIDLQTLFTQLDKVGKEQAAQKEGTAIQQALQGAQAQKKVEEQIQSVNEAQNMGEGAERVKDRNARKRQGGSSGKRGHAETPDEEEPGAEIIRDPSLGTHIDVSG